MAGTGDHIKELGESLSDLVENHLKLFKLEFEEDAKLAAIQVVAIVALLPLPLAAWGFLCVALAMAMSNFISIELSFVVVALINLIAGGVGIGIAVARLKMHKWFDTNRREAERSVDFVQATVKKEVSHA